MSIASAVVDGLLPRRSRGRPSETATLIYQEQVAAFCALILGIRSEWILTLGRAAGATSSSVTGCARATSMPAEADYYLPQVRRPPLDICAEDDSSGRRLPELDAPDIDYEAESWIDYLRDHAHENYTPIGFWDDLDVYVEVGVEKLDLRNLFDHVRRSSSSRSPTSRAGRTSTAAPP